MSKTAKWLVGIFSFLILFFLFIIFSFVAILGEDEFEDLSNGSSGTIAVVEVTEPIMSSENVVRQLKRFRENGSVRAIVLRIESPGGGVAASQEIYEEVKKTRAYGKPIVVSIGSMAASGGYYVAIGANTIVANPGSVTGSIGVISQFMHVNALLDRVGITATTVKSGRLKDAGSPFRSANAADRKYFQELIDDMHVQFVAAVAEERKMSLSAVKKLADGRVFTGKKAYELGLVDTLGTYQDAITIAAEMAEVYGSPRVIKERKRERWTERLFGAMRKEISNATHEMLNEPFVQYRYNQPQ